MQILPSNSPGLGFLSLIEGLLAGNICFIKLSASDDLSSLLLAQALFNQDSTGTIRARTFLSRFSSARKDCLQALLSRADGVAAWGSAQAVAGVRSLTPLHTRWIEWGPRISLILADPNLPKDQMDKIAQEICLGEQQACSSPQIVYCLQTSDPDSDVERAGLSPVLRGFAAKLAEAMDRIRPRPGRRSRHQSQSAPKSGWSRSWFAKKPHWVLRNCSKPMIEAGAFWLIGVPSFALHPCFGQYG